MSEMLIGAKQNSYTTGLIWPRIDQIFVKLGQSPVMGNYRKVIYKWVAITYHCDKNPFKVSNIIASLEHDLSNYTISKDA